MTDRGDAPSAAAATWRALGGRAPARYRSVGTAVFSAVGAGGSRRPKGPVPPVLIFAHLPSALARDMLDPASSTPAPELAPAPARSVTAAGVAPSD